MKQFAILFASVAMVGFMTSQSEAQRCHGHGHHHRGSNFSISVGNGFNGISYNRGYGGNIGGFYGGHVHAVPVAPIYHRPVYGGGYYGGGYGYYNPGVSINVGRGYGGYGGYGGGYYGGGGFYRGGCGGW